MLKNCLRNSLPETVSNTAKPQGREPFLRINMTGCAMTSKILLHFIGMSIGLGLTHLAHAQALVTIDGNVTFQTVQGWGGNTYSWILNGWNGWSNDRIYAIAFDESGVTHLRMVAEFDSWELENDDDDPHHFNWTYFASRFENDDNRALLVQSDFAMMNKIATAFEKKLMIGVWNVPDWMVSDPVKKDRRHLPPHRYAEFAESVAAYLLWARDERGIEISEIVLANEPDGTYLEYTPETLRDLIKVVGAKFQREGLATKIVAPDLASPYFDPDRWVTTLLDDSTAASYLSAISYHTYFVEGDVDQWNSKFARIAALAGARNLPVYFTEIGTTPWHIPNATWPWAFDCAQMWHNVLTRGNASLGYQWALLGRDHVVNPDATRNPIYYVLAQFFQHIPAGAVRIAATSNHRDLLVSAFKHAEKNRLQMVFINRSATEMPVEIVLQNLEPADLQSFRTSARELHIRTDDYQIRDNALQISIPALSVLTLTGSTNLHAAPILPPRGVMIKQN